MNEQINTTETNTVKPCRKCGAMDRYADGRCKSCACERARKYHEANPEKAVERQRKYCEANREKVAGRKRKYYQANREKAVDYARKYHRAYREKVAERQRKHYEANRDKAVEYARKYHEANREKRKVIAHNRRAKIKGNGGTLSKGIVQTLMALQKGKCACCGKSLKHGHHLDHVIPIALGGTNTDDNVQLLTPKCNLSKGAKHPVDYMRSKGKLI